MPSQVQSSCRVFECSCCKHSHRNLVELIQHSSAYLVMKSEVCLWCSRSSSRDPLVWKRTVSAELAAKVVNIRKWTAKLFNFFDSKWTVSAEVINISQGFNSRFKHSHISNLSFIIACFKLFDDIIPDNGLLFWFWFMTRANIIFHRHTRVITRCCLCKFAFHPCVVFFCEQSYKLHSWCGMLKI